MLSKDYRAELLAFNREKEFFIGFDSDGCVFDTMELKHKECFCPAVIKAMGCQSVSRVAREVWDFVNLYSKTRGCNRFHAIQYFRDLLMERSEVKAAHFEVPELKDLDSWVASESKLGLAALESEVRKTGSADLQRMLDWSKDLNARVEGMVFGMTPVAGVVDVLKTATERADLCVVSQTPLEALEREWKENDILKYISLAAAQEHGTKTEHIHYATKGKGYAPDKVLMVGDAPGDHEAARANNALFYPIIPGKEARSWERLKNEALERFFSGQYAGAYQDRLIREFDAALPESPPWV
jgi:phosphoglycolate phosphatase-like HAD superfamily hydrolase